MGCCSMYTNKVCEMCGNVGRYDVKGLGNSIYEFACAYCGNITYATGVEELTNEVIAHTDRKQHNRDRAYKRRQDKLKARRQEGIALFKFGTRGVYKNTHRYSKTKVHCSCRICTARSKSKYGYNMKVSDLRNMGLASNKRQSTHLIEIDAD